MVPRNDKGGEKSDPASGKKRKKSAKSEAKRPGKRQGAKNPRGEKVEKKEAREAKRWRKKRSARREGGRKSGRHARHAEEAATSWKKVREKSDFCFSSQIKARKGGLFHEPPEPRSRKCGLGLCLINSTWRKVEATKKFNKEEMQIVVEEGQIKMHQNQKIQITT